MRTLLSDQEKVKIHELIEHIERDTRAEICVMLLKDVENPRGFATQYFNRLGIGKRELDNGILILVVLDKHRIEIVVGRGLEPVLPQQFLERVINDTIAPHFRDERFGVGLHQAIEAFGRVLREHFPGARPAKPGKIPDVVDLDQGGRNP